MMRALLIMPICPRTCTPKKETMHAAMGCRSIPVFGARLVGPRKSRVLARPTNNPSSNAFRLTSASNASASTLDKSQKDEYGLYKVNAIAVQEENERKIYEAMNKAADAILQQAGGEVLSVSNFDQPTFNHQLGGCRMGSDPRTSVLDAFCRSHDVPNLYVVDGSVFPSSSEKNPTLTIMALAARTADHISDRLQKGEI